jgi:hypothetical protein
MSMSAGKDHDVRRGITMAQLAEPTPERYAALLHHYFGRLPPDIDGLTAWDAFDGDDLVVSNDELPGLFAHTMRRSGEDLAAFSDAQLAIGLQAMFSFQWSDLAHRLHGATAYLRGGAPVPVDARCAAIGSIATLYTDCLTPRVPAQACRGSAGALSYFCYMLWDVSPLGYWNGAGPEDDPHVAVLLEVLDAGLNSTNPACIESALHGLGHLGGAARKAASVLVGDLLRRRAGTLPPSLVKYARQARAGRIV